MKTTLWLLLLYLDQGGAWLEDNPGMGDRPDSYGASQQEWRTDPKTRGWADSGSGSGQYESTEERCRSDCKLPINVTHREWQISGHPRYKLTIEFLGGAEDAGHDHWHTGLGGVDTYRPIGPTRPPHTRGHPWFPHDHELTNPSKYASFCEAGCTFFYSANPSNVTCKRKCDQTYKYGVDGGYSDLAEVARYECYDGCDIALLRCQPGYRCDWPSTVGVAAEQNWEKPANMTPCSAGTYRPNDYYHVHQCFDCPPGRYRESVKGRSQDSCDKCPQARYVNTTGSAQHTDCLRCPAGRFSEEKGSGLCKCVTAWSCGDEAAYKRNAAFEGCNAETQECGTQERRETYPTLRKVSEYHLCKDKAMFEHRAGKDLYRAVVDPSLLDTNKEVFCDNYLSGDFNFEMQQLVTKVEERGHDGASVFDATQPRGFF